MIDAMSRAISFPNDADDLPTVRLHTVEAAQTVPPGSVTRRSDSFFDEGFSVATRTPNPGDELQRILIPAEDARAAARIVRLAAAESFDDERGGTLTALADRLWPIPLDQSWTVFAVGDTVTYDDPATLDQPADAKVVAVVWPHPDDPRYVITIGDTKAKTVHPSQLTHHTHTEGPTT